MNPLWKESDKTYVWLFNVGRGLSICIRLPNNLGIIYDLGNSSDFSPCSFIESEIIPHLDKYSESRNPAQLVISHPHQDHIQETKEINENDSFDPGLITLPHDKEVEGQENEKLDFSRIENSDNKDLIAEYKRIYEERTPPLQCLDAQKCEEVGGFVSYGIFYMRPPEVDSLHPSNDHHYGNGVSICLYLRHNRHSIWITGDVTPEVHECILSGDKSIEKRLTYFSNQPEDTPADFHLKTSSQLSPKDLFGEHDLSLLVAPHHGLESCFCTALFDSIPGGKPLLNVVSEKRHLGENDGKVDDRYSSKDYSRGTYVDIEGGQHHKRMVSTRNGHHMLFILGHDSLRPKVILRKDPYDLLNLK